MRMRHKKHFEERLHACEHLLLSKPDSPFTDSEPIVGWVGEMHLEIGCGKGGFAVQTAARHQDVCLVAMERVPNVMINALEFAERDKEARNDNLRFIIGNAEDLGAWFAPGTISVIYLNFSDPWLKARYHKRRLTHRRFLLMYLSLLTRDGVVYFKTDNEELFRFTLEELEAIGRVPDYQTEDLHHSPYAEGNIMTEYEEAFVSEKKPIFMLAFSRYSPMSARDRNDSPEYVDEEEAAKNRKKHITHKVVLTKNPEKNSSDDGHESPK